MNFSALTPGIISQLSSMVENYIEDNREKYVGKAAPLTMEQRTRMQAFFPTDLLDSARLLLLRGSRIQDPPFYTMARIMGIKNLPSFSNTAAVTFIDVIVSHEEFSDALLFHELVHAVQYALLGTKEFAARYVTGFLETGSYAENPLEKHAYELEQRFRTNPQEIFAVTEEVKLRLAHGRTS
jgi:hypothetical protein